MDPSHGYFESRPDALDFDIIRVGLASQHSASRSQYYSMSVIRHTPVRYTVMAPKSDPKPDQSAYFRDSGYWL